MIIPHKTYKKITVSPVGGDLAVMRRLEAGGGWIPRGTRVTERQRIVHMGVRVDEVYELPVIFN